VKDKPLPFLFQGPGEGAKRVERSFTSPPAVPPLWSPSQLLYSRHCSHLWALQAELARPPRHVSPRDSPPDPVKRARQAVLSPSDQNGPWPHHRIQAEVVAGGRQPPTSGKAGGKLPAGKTTAKLPVFSFSAASRKAAVSIIEVASDLLRGGVDERGVGPLRPHRPFVRVLLEDRHAAEDSLPGLFPLLGSLRLDLADELGDLLFPLFGREVLPARQRREGHGLARREAIPRKLLSPTLCAVLLSAVEPEALQRLVPQESPDGVHAGLA
jgi:hypothetical protein